MGARSQPGLAISTDAGFIDDLAWRAYSLGCHGIEIRDRETMTPGTAGRALLLAGFPDGPSRDAALAALAGSAGSAEIHTIDVADDGWSLRWREFFRPVVLERVQIVAPWMEPPRLDRLTVVIDPGQAFGTGGHPTTRLVLSMLERRAAGAGLPDRVLDVGCGSGVLAIAAVLLGAGSALGVDVDPEAVVAADGNVRVNRVSGRVSCTSRPVEEVHGAWPLVMANIELAVFGRMASAIAGRVAPGGELLVSGLLEDQDGDCRSLFAGFDLVDRLVLDGWVALALVRP